MIMTIRPEPYELLHLMYWPACQPVMIQVVNVIASSSSWSFHHMKDGTHVHGDGDQHGEQVP